jgi:peroxiredoxin
MQIKPTALTILLDPKSDVVSRYVARSMPSSFIIDKSGTIRYVHFGYSDKDPHKWREEIDRLIADETKK